MLYFFDYSPLKISKYILKQTEIIKKKSILFAILFALSLSTISAQVVPNPKVKGIDTKLLPGMNTYKLIKQIYEALDSISMESSNIPYRITAGEFAIVKNKDGNKEFIGTYVADRYQIGKYYILWNRLGEKFSLAFETFGIGETALILGAFDADEGVKFNVVEPRLKELLKGIRSYKRNKPKSGIFI